MLLREQVERVALAEMQAGLTAARMAGDSEFQPVNVAARMAQFDELLAADPLDGGDALAEQRIRELLEEEAA